MARLRAGGRWARTGTAGHGAASYRLVASRWEKGAAGQAWWGGMLGHPQNGAWEERGTVLAQRGPGGQGTGAPSAGRPTSPLGSRPPTGPQGIRHPVPQLSLSGGRGIFRAAWGPAGQAVTIFAHGSWRCEAGVAGGFVTPPAPVSFPFCSDLGSEMSHLSPGREAPGTSNGSSWDGRGSGHLSSVPGPCPGSGSVFPRR